MTIRKGTLSQDAAERIHRPDLAGQPIEYTLHWAGICTGKPSADKVYYNGEQIARIINLGPDGIIPEPVPEPPAIGLADPELTVALERNLTAYFSAGELRALCFDVNVKYGELSGDVKSKKVRALLEHLEREGRLLELAELVRQYRPNARWDAQVVAAPVTTAPPPEVERPPRPDFDGQSINRAKLRQTLVTQLKMEDLRRLCFDLGVDYDEVPGMGKAQKIAELLILLDDRGRLHELVGICSEYYSDVCLVQSQDPD
jgi:hypothetical protein